MTQSDQQHYHHSARKAVSMVRAYRQDRRMRLIWLERVSDAAVKVGAMSRWHAENAQSATGDEELASEADTSKARERRGECLLR